jgi:Translation initiation factor SUI1
VTTVSDFPLDDAGLQELASALKQTCGTGGTVKDGRIEIRRFSMLFLDTGLRSRLMGLRLS